MQRIAAFVMLAASASVVLYSAACIAEDLPIEIDNTRVVFKEEDPSASVSVRNKGDIPYLVAINVTEFCGVGQQCPTTDDFMASPGFKIIRPGQVFPFRVVRIADKMPADRESLYLVNFKIVPSEVQLTDKQLKSSRITVALSGSMKLFWRPEALSGGLVSLRLLSQLESQCTGNKLELINRSAYWATLSTVSANGKSLFPTGPLPMLAPFGNVSFSTDVCPREVTVAVIDDSGMPSIEQIVQVTSSSCK